ncbi:hypothetical protein EV127DRAFT_429968 [Xylaria flabelliformis]|nr:hypothetical protein EV127DRAFT_429968 [Xylaria flabelliformis]
MSFPQTPREPPFSASISTTTMAIFFKPPASSSEKHRHTLQDTVGTSSRTTPSKAASSLTISPIYVDAKYWSYEAWQPKHNISEFLLRELDVSRLNVVYKLLWWAGRQAPSRPLHRWKMLGLKISIIEQADLHLVWSAENLFLKPLPLYLLDYSFWLRFICDEKQPRDTYESARGFLLSYVWLIRYPSDLEIAKRELLLPGDMTWAMWIELVDSIWDHSGDLSCPDSISKRYKYGALRLTRLDHIYRFAPRFHLKYLLDGYIQSYSSFGGFFKREFAWLIVAFAYLTIILTGLQVGLETIQLRDNNVFNEVSYGFTIAAVMLPAVILAVVIILYVLFYTYHLSITLHIWIRRLGNEV